MVDILMYIFERFIADIDNEPVNFNNLVDELTSAGFKQPDIKKTILWLDGLVDYQQQTQLIKPQSNQGLRYFTGEERQKLGTRGINFLIDLELNHLLNTESREMVIDRAMAIQSSHLPLEQLKWVTLIVLFNCADQAADLEWMHNILFTQMNEDVVH